MDQHQIVVNFQQAINQAKELEELASQLRRMTAKEYAQSMQSLSNNWKSDSATAYLRKGAALQGKLNTSADNLEKIARNIRTTARSVYNAEMRALELARQRKR